MSKEVIRDSQNLRVLGYIEQQSDGTLRAVKDYRTLGYYDPRRNVTLDPYKCTTIASGNVLSGLIYNERYRAI